MTTVAYLAKDRFNHPIQALLPSTSQTVAIGASSAATANVLTRGVVVIRVVSTANCFVRIGTGTPTATTADTFVPAFTPEYFRVDATSGIRVAVIQQSGSGSLYVTEMN
jgi:hypothetical protein